MIFGFNLYLISLVIIYIFFCPVKLKCKFDHVPIYLDRRTVDRESAVCGFAKMAAEWLDLSDRTWDGAE